MAETQFLTQEEVANIIDYNIRSVAYLIKARDFPEASADLGRSQGKLWDRQAVLAWKATHSKGRHPLNRWQQKKPRALENQATPATATGATTLPARIFTPGEWVGYGGIKIIILGLDPDGCPIGYHIKPDGSHSAAYTWGKDGKYWKHKPERSALDIDKPWPEYATFWINAYPGKFANLSVINPSKSEAQRSANQDVVAHLEIRFCSETLVAEVVVHKA